MKWIKPELFWMKSLKKKSRQRKKYHTAAVPHAEELEMEFEDEFEDDDEDEEDEESDERRSDRVRRDCYRR